VLRHILMSSLMCLTMLPGHLILVWGSGNCSAWLGKDISSA
jgi:hypothetical protein